MKVIKKTQMEGFEAANATAQVPTIRQRTSRNDSSFFIK